MLQKSGITHAALLGVLFAAVAFSFALATSSGVSEQGGGAAIRAAAAGTQVQFTNPIISDKIGTDRDLGVAAVGSVFSRYCRAAYGVAPYKFTNAASSQLVATYGLTLDQTTGPTAGLVSGTLSALVGTLIRFDVTVMDSAITPTSATSSFRITVMPNNGAFQFATSTLDAAVQGRFYSVPLPPVIYGNWATASDLTYTVSAADTTTLTNAGLTIDPVAQTLSGVPFSSSGGTPPIAVTFTLNCKDKSGNFAQSADGKTVGQKFTLTVNPGAVSSGLLISALTIGANMPLKKGNPADSLKLTAITTLNPVSGQFLRVTVGVSASNVPVTSGSPTYFSATTTDPFNDKGKASGKGDAVTASISKGKLTIAATGQSITTSLASPVLVIVQILDATGKKIVAQVGENVQISPKPGRNNAVTFTLSRGGTPGGGVFMLTSVAGKDDKNTPSTAWKVGFVALPASGSFQPGPVDVTIGNLDLANDKTGQPIAVTTKGNGVAYKPASTAKLTKTDINLLATLAMDGKTGKGTLTTSNLTQSAGTVGKTTAATGTGITTSGAFYTNITLGAPATTYQGEGIWNVTHTNTSWK
ncbi:MAG: hypothetical protein ABSE73_05295 [Planctomycetota bacterium]